MARYGTVWHGVTRYGTVWHGLAQCDTVWSLGVQRSSFCWMMVAGMTLWHRSNDKGDLVVTKGDQYDVRESGAAAANGKGAVRNLGKPVDLAGRQAVSAWPCRGPCCTLCH